MLQYVLDMKVQGVVKHIGLSTHAQEPANLVLDKQVLDMLMYSINPMYDYGHGDFANGSNNERQNLYRRCEKEGVGISVMKPFNAGQLLDAGQSPFHQALTTAQCIQYALDLPGVLTVLGGPSNIAQLKEILKHCHPCPAGLDIGLIYSGKGTLHDTWKNCIRLHPVRTLQQQMSI